MKNKINDHIREIAFSATMLNILIAIFIMDFCNPYQKIDYYIQITSEPIIRIQEKLFSVIIYTSNETYIISNCVGKLALLALIVNIVILLLIIINIKRKLINRNN